MEALNEQWILFVLLGYFFVVKTGEDDISFMWQADWHESPGIRSAVKGVI